MSDEEDGEEGDGDESDGESSVGSGYTSLHSMAPAEEFFADLADEGADMRALAEAFPDFCELYLYYTIVAKRSSLVHDCVCFVGDPRDAADCDGSCLCDTGASTCSAGRGAHGVPPGFRDWLYTSRLATEPDGLVACMRRQAYENGAE